jgi:hypothetical protein
VTQAWIAELSDPTADIERNGVENEATRHASDIYDLETRWSAQF